jgi:two-component system, OmpR family, sensor histidine kinase BaeS
VSRPDRDRLAILVHEVRSSVAALAAIATAYPQALSDASARRPLVELALAASRGIERVVTDATVASVRLEDVDIGRLVDETVTAAVLGGGNVRAEVAAGLPLVQADPLRLRQALDNLVSNALLHSGSAGEVVVSGRRTETSILLSVADTGTGVPPADQERIFGSGLRLDSERPGSGLGLAVARAIAEAHAGTLTVDSVPGRGATFTVTLPLAALRIG